MKAIKEEAIKNGTWMKAPNGKATNLDEEQWLRVRTKAFKKWFGDWEKACKFMPIRKAKSVSEAAELIKPLIGKPITNELLGIIATISRNSLDKLISEKATKQSVSPRLHAMAVANIDMLFINAQFDIQHADKNGDRNISYIHRLGTLMFDDVSNSYIPIKITVKEFSNEQNKRIYSVEAIDIEEQKKSVGQLVSDSKENGTTPITDFDAKINELLESANNSSKVVDENGEPLVVYHSGASDIKEFSHEYDKTGIGRQFWGGGFYFGTVRSKDEWARRYEEKTGKQAKIYPIFLNLRNPKYSALGKSDINNYDGAILPSINTHEGKTEPIYIATSPNQIKSATENNGDFSGENNDIRFRSVSEELRETTEETMFSVKGYNPIAEKEVENIVVDTNGVPYSKDVALNKKPIVGLVKTNIDTGKNIKVSRKSLRHSALHDLKAV